MSVTWMSGRQGIPSESTTIFYVVSELATKSFMTRSRYLSVDVTPTGTIALCFRSIGNGNGKSLE